MEKVNKTDDPEQVLHDWTYIISEILEYEKYLTQKALEKIFLEYSFNKIIRTKDNLLGLVTDCKMRYGTKEIRKKISNAIKKGIDITPIVLDITREADIKWCIQNKLTGTTLERAIVFTEKMRKYVPQFKTSMLFNYFGRDNATKIIKGEYEGLFKEKLIPMTYEEFGEYILNILKGNRNKKINAFMAV